MRFQLLQLGYETKAIESSIEDVNSKFIRSEKLKIEPDPKKIDKVDKMLFKISKYSILFLVFIAIGILPFIFEKNIYLTIYLLTIVMFIKTIIYSIILYIILILSDLKMNDPFKKCFYGIILIVPFTLISNPILRFVLLILILVFVMITMFNASLKVGLVFVFFLIIAEVFFGFGLLYVEDNFLRSNFDSDIALVLDDGRCTQHKSPDEFSRDYLFMPHSNLVDYCTDSIVDKNSTTECKGVGCHLVEYSCILFEIHETIYNCTNGCLDGACLR